MIRTESLQLSADVIPERPSRRAVITQPLTDLGIIETAVVEGNQGSESVIFNLPWSEFVRRDDALDRYAIMAQHLGGVAFTAVDNPGVGRRAKKLKHSTAKMLRDGDFSSVAHAQWQAVDHEGIEDGLTLMGYSQGASMSGAMSAVAPENIAINRMVLWEPVTEQQKSLQLAARFAREVVKWGEYFAENPEWMHKPGKGPVVPKEMWLHLSAYYSYPIGLSKANLFNDLQAAREREAIDESTEIIIVSGNRSFVSPLEETARFAEKIHKSLGLNTVRLILLNESHGLIDSSSRVAELLRYLRSSG